VVLGAVALIVVTMALSAVAAAYLIEVIARALEPLL
jgi:hypothetical protein